MPLQKHKQYFHDVVSLALFYYLFSELFLLFILRGVFMAARIQIVVYLICKLKYTRHYLWAYID
jgi:hypothetical protein